MCSVDNLLPPPPLSLYTILTSRLLYVFDLNLDPINYDSNKSHNDGSEEWLIELKQHPIDHPDSIVGEIGLDGVGWREVKENYDNTNEGGKNDNITIWNRK